MRKKAAFSAIVRLRQQQIVARVGSPNIDPRSRIQPTGDPAVDAMEQMAAKLDAVVEASLEELQVAPTATLWTQILQELPPEESDYLAKAADEKFAEQMKYCSARKVEREIHACVAHHLEAILVSSVPTRNGQSMAKSMHHSLGDLLRDFRGVFLSCYEEFTQQYDVPQVAAVLPLVTADVLQFAGILVQLLLFKYAFLAKWKTHVRRCVLAALFDLLQPTLHGLYVGAFRTEDAVMEDIASLKRSTSPAEFGIAPVFRLDGSWQSPDAISPEASQQEAMRQYGAAIHRMNNLASIRSPWVKVEALALICREIDGTIKTYYAKQPVQPSHEEINMYVWRVSVSVDLLECVYVCHSLTNISLQCTMSSPTQQRRRAASDPRVRARVVAVDVSPRVLAARDPQQLLARDVRCWRRGLCARDVHCRRASRVATAMTHLACCASKQASKKETSKLWQAKQ